MTVKTDKFGRLDVVENIRDYWANEASDFTPWLAESIDLLGEAIGLELEVEERESRVGDFSADIVCRDNVGGRTVIVENQFDKTNHDHLGKLLTYAAGKEARVTVWIAEEFRDEHRAALDWLNENTAEGVHFFGIEIALLKIGDSAPAPEFHVVSKPNNWKKTLRPDPNLTETQKLQLKFWKGFLDLVAQGKGKSKPVSPYPSGWISFPIRRSGFHLDVTMGIRKSQIAVQLIMDGENAKAHYHLLLQEKDEVEKELGHLEWRALPDHQQKQVNLRLKDCDVRNEKQWGYFHSWLYKHLEEFYTVFHKRIQDLNADDWQSSEAQDEDD